MYMKRESMIIQVSNSDSNNLVQVIMMLDGTSPPAALVSDADNAITFTSLPLPDGPAMVKRIDFTKYMM